MKLKKKHIKIMKCFFFMEKFYNHLLKVKIKKETIEFTTIFLYTYGILIFFQ